MTYYELLRGDFRISVSAMGRRGQSFVHESVHDDLRLSSRLMTIAPKVS